MSIAITKDIQNFWNNFIDERADLNHLRDYKFEAWSFGNTKEMADDLGQLVLDGKKTATCSLLRAYRGEEHEIPRVGVYSVLCNGSNQPLCVVFLTHTWICKYSEVAEQHAYEEGEGDRTLEYWKKVHHEFFSAYDGFHSDDLLVCERFQTAFK
ncbi:MAG: RNA-binding protein [Halobacteriovorax sp.]|nr:RNA-binding protein [Halobacteriovorax sp.]|tara:strand:- start:307 stop:768 length:462 start_codon:yes stop_codon:yes gene_type:complete